MRGLAALVDVDPTHLSRVIRGKKSATPQLATRIASALDLPADYFAEAREQIVLDAMRSDAQLSARLYRLVTNSKSTGGSPRS